jgi:hypothetical protein
MAREEPSDPKIIERLKNIPPFPEDEETPQAPEEPQEADVEPQEAPEAPEPTVEAEGEAHTEKDRTAEQFDKLKEHNAQLKQELDKTKAQIPTKNALDSLYPEPPVYPQPLTTNVLPTPEQFPNLTPKEIKDTFASLVDSQGYVDSGLMIETFRDLDKKAKEAEQRAKAAEEQNKRNERRMDDFERKQVMKSVHEVFPKLDPENATNADVNNRFDQNFYDLFQGEIIRQWTTSGQADPMKVAEKVSGILYGDMKKADRIKAEQAELAKKNINATRVSSTSQRSNFKDQDELIMATRLGRKGAIAERLARAGQ